MRGIVYDGESTTLVEGLELRAPGPREVVVEIVAAGMCHSDLSFMSGLYPWPVPAVCGHEGAGIVAEVGEAVTHVKPGDHVIIATLAACGFCDQCNNGRPTSCRQTLGNASEIFTLDGKGVSNFAAASVFADRTVVRDVQVGARSPTTSRSPPRRSWAAASSPAWAPCSTGPTCSSARPRPCSASAVSAST